MIYSNEKGFILTCSCGCGSGLNITLDSELYQWCGDYCYITPIINGTIHDKTGFISNISSTATGIITLLKGKQLYKHDICIKKNDVEYLYNWAVKQKKSAMKNSTIPEAESSEWVFKHLKDNVGIFQNITNDKCIHLEKDVIFENEDDVSMVLSFYISKELNYKLKQTLKQVIQECKNNKYEIPEIFLTKVNFINFCDFCITNLEPYIINMKGE